MAEERWKCGDNAAEWSLVDCIKMSAFILHVYCGPSIFNNVFWGKKLVL